MSTAIHPTTKRSVLESFPLTDRNHKLPKSKGGKFVEENIEVLDPVEHMALHGNLRVRTPELEELKGLMDDYKKVQSIRMMGVNQLLAMKRRTDKLNPDTIALINANIETMEKGESVRKKAIEEWMRVHKNSDPILKAILSGYGMGIISAAAVYVYVNINKAKHPSSFWQYFGIAGPSVDRYKKGKKGGGNKFLRAVLFTMDQALIRKTSPYREIYDNRKAKTAISEKLTKERGGGEITEVMWKNATKFHRDMDARRVLHKHFLADLWFVWRTASGLSTNDLYVKEHLGHESAIIDPKKRGWKF
jgi:hypothetical protein